MSLLLNRESVFYEKGSIFYPDSCVIFLFRKKTANPNAH